jgi:hypothetical protein
MVTLVPTALERGGRAAVTAVALRVFARALPSFFFLSLLSFSAQKAERTTNGQRSPPLARAPRLTHLAMRNASSQGRCAASSPGRGSIFRGTAGASRGPRLFFLSRGSDSEKRRGERLYALGAMVCGG